MNAQVNGRPSGRRAGRTPAARAAALIALCSLTAACSLFGPEELGVVWDTPVEDTKGAEKGNGAWLSGDTLVRSRFDAVCGYEASSGKRSWEYVPPGRSAICHATADTGGSVVVLVRDAEGASSSAKGKDCAVAVAIDMKTGGELWQTAAPASAPALARALHPEVSAGSGVAVLVDGHDLRALDVRTGQPRWKAALPDGCLPGRTAVAERQVAALLACGGTKKSSWDEFPSDAELHAAAFDPAGGALLWSTPLGGRTSVPWDARAEFVSADPVVVAASESGDSDSGAYLSFGGTGRPNPPIEFSGPYGEIKIHDRLDAAADGTRLYTVPRRGKSSRTYSYTLTAFDLATGKRVWDDDLDGDTAYRILPEGEKLTVVTGLDDSPEFGLRVMDAATGKQRESRGFPEGHVGVDTVFRYKGRFIGARYEGSSSEWKPFTAYELR
ncbi:PQQ-binding-like beta-propeller repeat protein [Streptomyces sp. TBY4]|uniref:outer membrane protein assembly factor BamB family protein n=1 Tax=Streptomyces sp. TBY4 TaxID=2962030 RepID=UPI0020B88432|nr:PQQ-binding-like beta-propeller repeat protein [Streptomyces sp. TBY4]